MFEIKSKLKNRKQIGEYANSTLHPTVLERGRLGHLGSGYDQLGASKLLLSLAF